MSRFPVPLPEDTFLGPVLRGNHPLSTGSGANVAVVVPEGMAESANRIKAIKAAEAARPGVIASAFRQESLIAWFDRAWRKARAFRLGSDDPNYNSIYTLPKEQFEIITAGIPESYWSVFDEARSVDQAMHIAGATRTNLEAEAVLTEAGFGGFLARIAAGVFDPPALAIGLGSGYLIGAAMRSRAALNIANLASKRSRLMAVGAAGGITMAEGGTIEAVLATNLPDRDVNDVIFAMAGSLILGAAGGVWGARSLKALEGPARRLQAAVLSDDAAEVGAKVTAKGKAAGLKEPGSKVADGKKVVEQQVADMEGATLRRGETLEDVARRNPQSDSAADIMRVNQLIDEGHADQALTALVSKYPTEGIDPKVLGMTPDEAVRVNQERQGLLAEGRRQSAAAGGETTTPTARTEPTPPPENAPTGVEVVKIRDTSVVRVTRGGETKETVFTGPDADINAEAMRLEVEEEMAAARAAARGNVFSQGGRVVPRRTEKVFPETHTFEGNDVHFLVDPTPEEFRQMAESLAKDPASLGFSELDINDGPSVRWFLSNSGRIAFFPATEAQHVDGARALKEVIDVQGELEVSPSGVVNDDDFSLEVLRDRGIITADDRVPDFRDRAAAQAAARRNIFVMARDGTEVPVGDLGGEVTITEGPDVGAVGILRGTTAEGEYVVELPDGRTSDLWPFELEYQGRVLRSPDAENLEAVAPELHEGIRQSSAKNAQGLKDAGEGGKPPPPPEPGPGDFNPIGKSHTGHARWGAVRFSLAGALGSSVSDWMRRAASIVASDAIPKSGEFLSNEAASEWTRRTAQGYIASFWSQARPLLNQHLDKQGLSFGQKLKAVHTDEYMDNVGRQWNNPNLTPANADPDSEIDQMALWLRDYTANLLAMSRRHGTRGLERTEVDPFHRPRIYSITAINRLIADFGGKAEGVKKVEDLIFAGLDNAHKNQTSRNPKTGEMEAWDPARGRRWAKGILQVVLDTDQYSDLQRSQLFSGEATQALRTALESLEEGGSKLLSEDDLSFIMRFVAPGKDESPLTFMARQRSQIDEAAEFDAGIDIHGKHRLLRFNDITENNAAQLAEMMATQLTGAAAMSKVLEEMSRQAGRELSTVERLFGFLRDDMRKQGMSPQDISRDISKLDTVIKSVMGRRLTPDKSYSAFLLNLRLFNLLRVGGQFGIAQLPEFGSILGSVGLATAARQMPAFGAILSTAAKGELKLPLLKEIHDLALGGLSAKTSEVLPRMDVSETLSEFGSAEKSRLMRRGARGFSFLNGMLPVHVAQQRSVAILASQKFLDIARSGRPFGPQRLKSLGLTPEDGDIISKLMLEHSTTIDGALGPRLTRLGINDWKKGTKDGSVSSAEGMAAVGRYSGAIQKWSERVVQVDDIGNLTQWMTGDIGRMIIQFRTFAFNAYEKQFLARGAMIADGVKHGEKELAFRPFMEMMWSTQVAALAYVTTAYFNSAGRPDRKEFLEEALTPGKIAAVSWQRAGFASLTPEVMDTTAYFLGFDTNMFTGRTSGLGISTVRNFPEGLLSNASFDFLEKGLISLRAGAKSIVGGTLPTQTDVRNLTGMAPGARLPILMNLGNALLHPFPEERR